MRHYTHEQIDAYLDGNTSSLWQWWMTRHIARCPQCRKLRDTLLADRALLDELRHSTAAHDAIAREMPATIVVAPSLSQRKNFSHR